MTNNHKIFVSIIFVFLSIISSSIFIVEEREQCVIVQFGDPRKVIRDPGLYFKIPLIQDVVFFDKRLLDYDLPAQTITAGDQKFVLIDSFTRYRIADSLSFYKTVGTESKAQDRLKNLVIDAMRSVLGQVPLSKLLSEERVNLMHQIKKYVDQGAQKFGIDVVDVRIKRADLPKQNYESIFQRMRSERDREAKELRAVGTEIAQTVRSEAEKDRTILIAEAQKEAQILKGKGEAEALSIITNIAKQDSKFYQMYKSYQTYQSTFDQGETTFVLSPKNGFFEYFN